MPITLEQAKELSQSKLTGQIIDEFVTSPLMGMLTFDNTVKVQGGKTLAYVYDRITTQPSAGTRAINGEYTAQETVASQEVANLKIMGGSYEIDRVIAKDETQVVNHVEFQSAQKAKAAKALFHHLFINGDSAVDAEQFDGIDKAITGSTTEYIPASVIDLSTATKIKDNYRDFQFALRKMIGSMDGITLLLVNNDTFTAFQTLADHIPNVTYSRDELGNEFVRFGNALITDLGDRPGGTKPVIEIATDGTTDIYGVRLGLDGVHGISPDGNDLINTYLPDFTTPGAVKFGEVEFVGASVIKATRSAGVIRKIKVR